MGEAGAAEGSQNIMCGLAPVLDIQPSDLIEFRRGVG